MIENVSALSLTDDYKLVHYRMYPKGTKKIYSNLTPRKSRIEGIDYVVVASFQYLCMEYLIDRFNRTFFAKPDSIAKFKRLTDYSLGKDVVTTEHIQQLWDLQYLPIKIKALPEGTLAPIGTPILTITNTVDHAYWLVNYLETLISDATWQMITSATIAHDFKKLLDSWAIKTTGSTAGVEFQAHDFSMRGMSSPESAMLSAFGHILSFKGSDTFPVLEFAEMFYGANVEHEMIATSVPATEHSVMCAGTKDDEIGTFRELLLEFPTGIISIVSDTWDLWKVLTEFLPQLKGEILERDGKLVIRPDSGDPVDIICGKFLPDNGWDGEIPVTSQFRAVGGDDSPSGKGLIELLDDVFGSTINEQGYKVLNPHIGGIYGDSITRKRAEQILVRLAAKGYASTNIVLGIGSYTYQYNTRDTFGFAVKATYAEVINWEKTELVAYSPDNQVWDTVVDKRELFKDPITDDGTKKSRKGLLRVEREDGKIVTYDQQTEEQEEQGLLELLFLDGKLIRTTTLSEIRARLTA